jgi:hypothetical protein
MICLGANWCKNSNKCINSVQKFLTLIWIVFYLLENSAKHLKINNISFMNLKGVSNFQQVQGTKKGFYTKN